jgi:hypothetical protein
MSAALGVARLEAAAQIKLAHINAARAQTEQGLEERRKRLADMKTDDGATVVPMGS